MIFGQKIAAQFGHILGTVNRLDWPYITVMVLITQALWGVGGHAHAAQLCVEILLFITNLFGAFLTHHKSTLVWVLESVREFERV